MDESKLPVSCIQCGELIKGGKEFCTSCGTRRSRDDNHCVNKNCADYQKSIPAKDMFCAECGKPTKRGQVVQSLL